MDPFWVAIGSACWLGVLTSVSPCPLATNVAAITYIGQRVDRPSQALWSGLAYTLGRTVCYVGLAVLIVTSIWSMPEVARFLQKYMNQMLGPVLVLTGLVLLNLIRFRLPGFSLSDAGQKRLGQRGVWGAGLLGLIFALSFCPVSAALYFGSLLPLAVEYESRLLLPTLYGVGTALPVVILAILIATGSRYVGRILGKLTVIERWARRVTGAIFVLVGLYLILIYLVGLDLF
jgi:cytochrome c biogenesis protein CcdA